MTEMVLVGFAGFQEEGENVYLYQCPKCKKVVFNINDTECDCDEKNSMQIIVSKRNWIDFLNGKDNTLRAYSTNELHHEFGDCPEEYIQRIHVSGV